MTRTRREQRVLAMYYLDLRPIAQIAQELRISRERVRDIVDDPTAQEEYLARAARSRRRARARLAAAADMALERQLDLIGRENVPDELIPAQQLAAHRVLKAALETDQDDARGEAAAVRIIDDIPAQ